MPFTTLGVNGVLADIIADTLYLALVWNLPSDSDTGSTISEITGSGYSRLTLTPATWTTPSGGLSTYGAALQWSIAVTWDQTIVGYAICTASSAGNLVAYDYVGYPVRVTVMSGATTALLTIPANGLSIGVS